MADLDCLRTSSCTFLRFGSLSQLCEYFLSSDRGSRVYGLGLKCSLNAGLGTALRCSRIDLVAPVPPIGLGRAPGVDLVDL